jgi:hypothetical protein
MLASGDIYGSVRPHRAPEKKKQMYQSMAALLATLEVAQHAKSPAASTFPFPPCPQSVDDLHMPGK